MAAHEEPVRRLGFWNARAQVILPVAGALFLLLISVGNLPHLAAEASSFYGDKPLHLVFYALVSLLIYSAIAWHPAVLTVLIITALGLLDESIQSFFPYRSTELLDLLIDIASSITTVILLHIGSVFLGNQSTALKP